MLGLRVRPERESVFPIWRMPRTLAAVDTRGVRTGAPEPAKLNGTWSARPEEKTMQYFCRSSHHGYLAACYRPLFDILRVGVILFSCGRGRRTRCSNALCKRPEFRQQGRLVPAWKAGCERCMALGGACRSLAQVVESQCFGWFACWSRAPEAARDLSKSGTCSDRKKSEF